MSAFGDIAELEILLKFKEDGQKALDDAKGGMFSMKEAGAVAATGLLAVGAAVIGFAGLSAHAAEESQSSMALLNQTLKDTGQSAGPAFQSGFLGAEASNRKFGITNLDTMASVRKLIAAGVDEKTALKDQATIADLAAAKHVDLATATDMVIKGAMGAGRELKTLGVILPIPTAGAKALATAQAALTKAQATYDSDLANGKGPAILTKDLATLKTAQEKVTQETDSQKNHMQGLGSVIDQLNQKVGGDAAAKAATFQGAWAAAKAELDHVEETVGTRLLPIMSKFMGYVVAEMPKVEAAANGVLNSIQDNWPKIQTVLNIIVSGLKVFVGILGFVKDHFDLIWPVLAVVVAGWVAWNVAIAITKAIGIISMIMEYVGGLATMVSSAGLATTAQWLLNMAMDANPIGLIIIAVGLLIAIVILVVTHMQFFTGVINSVWTWIENLWKTVETLVDRIGGFKTILLILLGPLGIAILAFKTAYEHSYVFKAAVDAVVGAIGNFINWLGSVVGSIGNFIGGVARGIDSIFHFSDAFHVIGDTINNVLGFLGNIAGTFANTAGNIGSSIIHGIVSGIWNAGGAIVGALKSVLTGALGWVGNLLGIHSPSTVFADMVGLPIAQGIGVGIIGGQAHVNAALAQVTKPKSITAPMVGGSLGAISATNSASQNATNSSTDLSSRVDGTNQRLDAIIAFMRQMVQEFMDAQKQAGQNPGAGAKMQLALDKLAWDQQIGLRAI